MVKNAGLEELRAQIAELASRLERQLTLFGADARGMGREAIRGLGRTIRGERDGGHWMEQLMGPEQRFRKAKNRAPLVQWIVETVE